MFLPKNVCFSLGVILSSLIVNIGYGDAVHDGIDKIVRDQAIKKVFPALVKVNVVVPYPYQGRIVHGRGSGSGVIIDSRGYVVTNHHVAGNASHITCTLSNFETIDAELVGTDALSDIAVIKLKLDQRKDRGKALPVANWGDSDRLKVGDVVYALGSPVALSQSATRGVVSNTRMILPRSWGRLFKLDGESVGALVRWIGHDAAIYPGNSGGPLVDRNGNVVGINEISIGLGGAIPSNLAKFVAEEIIKQGTVERTWTGIEAQPRLRSITAKKGILVASIIKNSPADHSGIKPGDIITTFDGISVDAEYGEEIPAFNNLMFNSQVGKKVKIELLRGKAKFAVDLKPQALHLVIGKRGQALAKLKEIEDWGLLARNITVLMQSNYNLKTRKGIFVHSTRPGGVAYSAKPALLPEDIVMAVDGEKIDTIDELLAYLGKVAQEKTKTIVDPITVLLRIKRNEKNILSVLTYDTQKEHTIPVQAEKGWLPLDTQVLTPQLAKALKRDMEDEIRGVRITRLYPNTSIPLRVGDIITAIDGTNIDAFSIKDKGVFNAMIQRYEPKAKVRLDIIRNGEAMKLDLHIQAQPKKLGKEDCYIAAALGFTACRRDLSLLDQQTIDKQVGVRVVKVERGGWAHLAGLLKGDILLELQGQAIPDVQILEKQLLMLKETQPTYVTFFVRRDDKAKYTEFLEVRPLW